MTTEISLRNETEGTLKELVRLCEGGYGVLACTVRMLRIGIIGD